MVESENTAAQILHSHVFLGEKHVESERRTWVVIALCGAMMIAEIVGGLLFGSIALVADGFSWNSPQRRDSQHMDDGCRTLAASVRRGSVSAEEYPGQA